MFAWISPAGPFIPRGQHWSSKIMSALWRCMTFQVSNKSDAFLLFLKKNPQPHQYLSYVYTPYTVFPERRHFKSCRNRIITGCCPLPYHPGRVTCVELRCQELSIPDLNTRPENKKSGSNGIPLDLRAPARLDAARPLLTGAPLVF